MYIKNALIRKNKWYSVRKTFNSYYSSSSLQAPIATAYKPKDIEQNIHKKWNETEKTKSQDNAHKPKFSMILPPPNVTGNLHLGHALMCTIQDVICRRKLQQGYNVVWVPGTDHAGIATQVVVEKKLLQERNVSRYDLGRDEFIKEVWKWKENKGSNIAKDLKNIGCLLDWNREYFTMDKSQGNAVVEAFVQLFDAGLIYRDKSLVNWSCSLESTISDIEVEMKEITEPILIQVPGHEKPIKFGQLYDIAYKVCQQQDTEIVVSTTRPETLLGDVAVAVHPNDERYKRFMETETKLWHPFRNIEIPLIYDESVDREFGTGAVKITPSHDKNDFELAKRHALAGIEVFNGKGRIVDRFPKYTNLPRFDGRHKILEDLASLNLLKSIKPHKMSLPMCSRSNDVIEYMMKEQWFLNCTEMAQEAMAAVRDGKIKIQPTKFENDWFQWLSKCRDWCVSRQLWWGHQIPAYLAECNESKQWIVARSENEALLKAEQIFNTKMNIKLTRDSDVLDTWFSSSLLPFSIFGWPNEDFKLNYPLDLMETGHDILFFWVARMVMLGQKLTGNVPFRNILLNGIVCDIHGRKMSKSLGNVITPEQVINGASFDTLKNEIQTSHKSGILNADELKKSIKGLTKTFPNGIAECGTDALRFTLCSHNIKNHFINFDVSECHTNKLFFNKIWQATRYTLGSLEKLNIKPFELALEDLNLSNMDKWILSRLAHTKKICNQSYENYNFHGATNALKTFFYTNFCDVYLETTKLGIAQKNEKSTVHCSVLAICLSLGLQEMAPLTPFLSEQLLEYFPDYIKTVDPVFLNMELEKEVNSILEMCMALRQFKSQHNITKKHEPKVHIFPQSDTALKLIGKYLEEIRTLTMSTDVFLENNTNHKRKNQFSILSTGGYLCSYGITTNELYKKQISESVNVKKLNKLKDDLSKLLRTVSSDGYKKSASDLVQKNHNERIKQLEIEINTIVGISV